MVSKDDPARAERLAAALRDNLRRRKAQSRAHAAVERPGEAPAAKVDEAGEPG